MPIPELISEAVKDEIKSMFSVLMCSFIAAQGNGAEEEAAVARFKRGLSVLRRTRDATIEALKDNPISE